MQWKPDWGLQPDLDLENKKTKVDPNLVQMKYHTIKGAFGVLSLLKKMQQMWNGG